MAEYQVCRCRWALCGLIWNGQCWGIWCRGIHTFIHTCFIHIFSQSGWLFNDHPLLSTKTCL